jgi:hypothetical protein
MFHFPAFPPHALYIQAWVTALTDGRVPPFGHPRITARLAAPRGLSRPTTSFIGSWCQGIHRAPLKTWPQRCSHPLFRSQTPTGSPPTQPRRIHDVCDRRPGTEEDNHPHPANRAAGTAVPSGPNSVPNQKRPEPTRGSGAISLRCSTRERRRPDDSWHQPDDPADPASRRMAGT